MAARKKTDDGANLQVSALRALRRELRAVARPERVEELIRYFDARPGGVAERDIFLGLTVPAQRKIARRFRDLSPAALAELLDSDIHEERFVALVILIDQFRRAEAEHQGVIHLFFLQRLDRVNHWDLVDLAAPVLLGEYLAGRARPILWRLLRSENPWERRAAVVATLAFIRREEIDPSLAFSERLFDDPNPYVHKACGWVLRESGKIAPAALHDFLHRHCEAMPAHMFSYATEYCPIELKDEWKKRRKQARGTKRKKSERGSAPRTARA